MYLSSSSSSSSSSSFSTYSSPWRFLKNPSTIVNISGGGTGIGATFNVVFAGPHFQAAIPAIEHELRSRNLHYIIPVSCRGGRMVEVEDQNITSNKMDTDDQHQHQHQHQGDDKRKRRRRKEGISDSTIRLLHASTPELLVDMMKVAHVGIPFMERFTSQLLLDESSPNLQLIIQYGVGLEGVDIDAATRAGIVVSNIPASLTGNAQATSEHAIWLAISLLRYSQTEYERRFLACEIGGIPIPRTLFRKKVTVVGFGSVGKVLTKYLDTMGADVTVVRKGDWKNESTANIRVKKNDETADCAGKHNENTDADDDDDGEYDYRRLLRSIRKETSLQRGIEDADVVFLACPLTPDTVHCINHHSIQQLKDGCLVVNIARGGLVEYDSMLEALKSGKVGGYASDVGIDGINNVDDDSGNQQKKKPSEPWDPTDEISTLRRERELELDDDDDHGKNRHLNVIFTPHVGGYSDYSYDIMATKIVDSILAIRNGKPPPVSWVNNEYNQQ